MIEAHYTSSQVVAILRDDGIRCSRERMNQMADALFGPQGVKGTHRRLSVSQAITVRDAFRLTDRVRLPRPIAIALHNGNGGVLDALSDDGRLSVEALHEAMLAVQDGWAEFQAAQSFDKRLEVAHRIRDAADTITRVRRLVAA